ncbi:ATP-binding protein [Streptomyces cuspidosporus]|uniref:Histidine kinase/HSP90-like ATPase domain-containing protein n=1 Tax=Streptomyces cuspidosporus TaxID=66882 RepID=A0ABN3H973_9ACTN
MTANPPGAVATAPHPLRRPPQPRCRRTGPPHIPATPQGLTLRLATDPTAAARARRTVAAALRDWGVPDDAIDDIVLMADELVTNAIEHAGGPVWLRLRLHRGRCVICKVGDGSREAPRLRHSDSDAENGRGLVLVAALADAFGARVTTTGKVIWFRRRVRSTGVTFR